MFLPINFLIDVLTFLTLIYHFFLLLLLFVFVLTIVGQAESWLVITLYRWPPIMFDADRNPMHSNHCMDS